MTTTTGERATFSTDLIRASVVHAATDVPITEPSVVVNLAMSDGSTAGVQPAPLPPYGSTSLSAGRVSGELVLVLSRPRLVPTEWIARDMGWTDFYAAGGPVLLRSPQHDVGTVALDVGAVLRQDGLPTERRQFALKANLWFAPAGTDCGIHDTHPFIEVHTQVSGYGRMQKFTSPDHASLYEDQQLSPGTTSPVPFCVERDGRFVYPWHQYRADTDCIWLALEYHETEPSAGDHRRMGSREPAVPIAGRMDPAASAPGATR
ncbi:MAG: hypothetical protein ACRCYX_05900 [Dermatophilaceae bacterium]